ncbi:uncharacterized protein LOC131648282 isoform X2 [Vicia villosa]|uniref:uncharacterized protein LOC131648282 isoform X2 n=1 Tax=Vicia villosa TaxID=3911 RepID=UPI00273C2F8A|nr:uncharacterized protein LOC131648282 isoform X2 [Vicia villosa]
MGQGQEEKIRPQPQIEIQVLLFFLSFYYTISLYILIEIQVPLFFLSFYYTISLYISFSTSQKYARTQERGEIYFFYRPKVSKEEAHSADDVQRLYIIMRPESGERPVEVKQEDNSKSNNNGAGASATQEVNIENQPLFRFIVMGRKKLPDPKEKSRPYWGFVEMVTTNADHVKNALRGGDYETSTKGHRHNSDARALGEGIYRILRHKQEDGKKTSHTHLIYKLEFPGEGEKNEPQQELNIEREGSFIIQIKNPEKGGAGLQKKRKAVFPAHLQGELGHVRFGPADPPDFLNYEGCEFLLISASDDIEDELGLKLVTESCSDLLNTFKFEDDDVSVTPFLKGIWV